MRSTRAPALLVVAVLLLAGCGSGQPESVDELRDMIIEAGLPCEVYSQVDPSGRSAGHGSCQPADVPGAGEDAPGAAGFGLDVYADEEDRAATVEPDEVSELLPESCTVWGPLWSVWFSEGRGVQAGDAARLVDQLDAETDCTG